MSEPLLTQETVLDLVPYGNVGGQPGCYALRLTPPRWRSWKPGQFVMLRIAGSGAETIWGRPFSISLVSDRDLVILFQVRGRVTAAMSRLVHGDVLDIWGPLGNGLAVESKTPTLLLAGGIGIAPFVGYTHAHPTPWDVTMEFGHRLPLDCYPYESVSERVQFDAHQEKGPEDLVKFLALMEKRITAHAPNGLVLACGPTPFLQAVQAISRRCNARTQLCLETRMACGIGACLGCVVKSTLPAEASCPVAIAPEHPLSGAAGRAGRAETAAAPFRPQEQACEPAPPQGTVHHVQTCTCGPNFWADTVIL